MLAPSLRRSDRWPHPAGHRRVHVPGRRARIRARFVSANRRCAHDGQRRNADEPCAADRSADGRGAVRAVRLAFFVRAAWRRFRCVLACFARSKLKETNTRRNPHALRIGSDAAHLRQPSPSSAAFRAYTLSAAATYAGLFAFLSGSSFVLIDVLGQTPISFALWFSAMVLGYVIGTLICRWLLATHGIQRTVYAGATVQTVCRTRVWPHSRWPACTCRLRSAFRCSFSACRTV